MQRRSVIPQFKLGILMVFISAICVLSSLETPAAIPLLPVQEAEEQQPEQKQEAAPQYAGSDTCMGCHDEIYTLYSKTAHVVTVTSNRYKESMKGCEGCHGPGLAHADAGGDPDLIFNPKRKTPGEANDRCLTCHQQQEERHNFRQSEHGLSRVRCIDCHSVHPTRPTEHLLAAEETTLCYQCHGEVRQAFKRPYHHRVHERGMSCHDCHNPHGGFNMAQTRAAAGGTDEVCLKCHTEKQGPFVFEHAPVKLEGCTICHLPHGSNNSKMLKRTRVAQLCLECHSVSPGIFSAQPPAFHNVRNVRYQNCTICHVKIHGSNANRSFLQ